MDETDSGVDESTPSDLPTQLLDFSCPRCAAEVSEEFYGPCSDCRATMRVIHGADVDSSAAAIPADFEPKMNVTPNAVALKD